MEDFDEEDWDDSWLDEPRLTYAEAMARLARDVASRVDVKLEWSGQRGPRKNARLAFLDKGGAEILARRIGSAEQAETLGAVVRGAHPMPGWHALWYPREDVIVARLVGDYDDLISAVARRIAHLKARTRTSIESPLGRDVLGLMSSSGVLVVTDDAATSSGQERSLRLKLASTELGTLYRRGYQGARWLAVELRDFGMSDVHDAEQVLAEYGASYLHEIARSSGVSLRLWNSGYRMTCMASSDVDRKVRFPVHRYDPIPAALYAAGNAADRDPLERYLKFYQVLEYYMPRAAEDLRKKQGVDKVNKAITPYPTGDNDRLNAERNKLAAVIDDSVTDVQITGFLRGGHALTTLSDRQVIRDVRVLAADQNGNPVRGKNYRQDLSERVYEIRCRIVHAKESDGGKNKDLLLPYDQEARDLGADIEVVRFLAERALKRWAGSLSTNPGGRRT